MSSASRPGHSTPPASAVAEVANVHRVGWRFISLYTSAYMGSILMLLAPVLVTLALKINALVGTEEAPNRLALVTATGSLLAMVSNPVFGKLSDRTASQLGMRRPWMLIGLTGGSIGILVVALVPNIAVVLIGWCVVQVFSNALLVVQAAVLPDQVPSAQRGLVSGFLGVCLPIASISGTFLVQLFSGNQLAMFLAPCAFGGFFVLLFAVTLRDRRLATTDRPTWSLRELAGTFYVDPRTNPDFAWAFASRFMFVLAYAFLTTYQAYYLLDRIGSAEADVPRQIFLGALAQSVVVIAASLMGGPALGPDGSTQGVRPHRRDRVRTGDVHGCRGEQLQRFPHRCGHQRTGLRHVRGRGPRAGRRRAAEQGQRQGSRGVQHRQCAPVLGGARRRARHPRGRRRQLWAAVRGGWDQRDLRSGSDPARQTCPVRPRRRDVWRTLHALRFLSFVHARAPRSAVT